MTKRRQRWGGEALELYYGLDSALRFLPILSLSVAFSSSADGFTYPWDLRI